MNKDVKNYAIDALNDLSADCVYGCDLHNEIFNTDYFIIGHYAAEQWLIKNPGIFQAIEDIAEYEQDHFGEVHTNFSSAESVANMWAFIEGEKILAESKVLNENWDRRLTAEAIEAIKTELEAL